MAEFSIDLAVVKKSAAGISGLYKEIEYAAERVKEISDSLPRSGFSEIRKILEMQADELKAEARACREFGTVLGDIEKVYRDTEQRIVNTKLSYKRSADGSKEKEESGYKKFIQRMKNLVADMIKRMTGDKNIEEYEIDSIVFDEEESYGGDQGLPADEKNSKRLKQLYNIIEQNNSDITIPRLGDYLKRLNNEGCGYVALVNVILMNFEGREADFESAFGYPMYGEDGSLNYDLLLVDLYSTMDNIPIGGNEPDLWNDYDEEVDGSRKDYDFWKDTTGNGSAQEDREYYIETFMDAHGVEVNAVTDVKVDIYNYDDISEEGKQIIIAFRDGNLYNADGTVAQSIEGGHAMVVTGVTSDGRMIVSSWGKKYYIDPDENANLTYNGKKHDTTMTFSTIEFK